MDRRDTQTNSSFIESDLLQMQLAPNYTRWMLSLIGRHLGKRILEVGSGVGTLTGDLLKRAELVCALEPNPYCVDRLRSSLAGYPQLVVINKTLEECGPGELAAYGFDTLLCCNVLEHIKDDLGALVTFREALSERGGKVILWVPAVSLAYGPIDKAVGHYRRYSKAGLLSLVRAAGLRPVAARYSNLLGLAGWLFNAHVRRCTAQSDAQIRLFNRLVPVLSLLENLLPPPIGMSLLVVAETTARKS